MKELIMNEVTLRRIIKEIILEVMDTKNVDSNSKGLKKKTSKAKSKQSSIKFGMGNYAFGGKFDKINLRDFAYED